MNGRTDAASRFALVIGVLLLIEGIWGHFSHVVFGVLTTNPTHAAIHILLGLIGIYTGLKGGARQYCLFLGGLLLVVGVLRFVPGVGSMIVSILNVNEAVAIVNIVVGAIALMIGLRSASGGGPVPESRPSDA